MLFFKLYFGLAEDLLSFASLRILALCCKLNVVRNCGVVEFWLHKIVLGVLSNWLFFFVFGPFLVPFRALNLLVGKPSRV